MKYIRLFEQNKNQLKKEITNWLSRIKPNDNYKVKSEHFIRGEQNGITMMFDTSRATYYGGYPLFVIRISEVSDKKQKELKIKTKLKIQLDYRFATQSSSKEFDDDFVTHLKDFMKDIFTKYSYFNKKIPNYYSSGMSGYDIFINVNDIENIVSEFDNFNIYIDSKKYNI